MTSTKWATHPHSHTATANNARGGNGHLSRNATAVTKTRNLRSGVGWGVPPPPMQIYGSAWQRGHSQKPRKAYANRCVQLLLLFFYFCTYFVGHT
jgi:hypothetical protein